MVLVDDLIWLMEVYHGLSIEFFNGLVYDKSMWQVLIMLSTLGWLMARARANGVFYAIYVHTWQCGTVTEPIKGRFLSGVSLGKGTRKAEACTLKSGSRVYG